MWSRWIRSMPNMVTHEGRCYIVNDTKYRVGGGGGSGRGRGAGTIIIIISTLTVKDNHLLFKRFQLSLLLYVVVLYM